MKPPSWPTILTTKLKYHYRSELNFEFLLQCSCMFLYHLNTNLCLLVYSVMTRDKTKFKSVCEKAPKSLYWAVLSLRCSQPTHSSKPFV